MKKIVRLTEQDLVKLVKRIINEQQQPQIIQGSGGDPYQYKKEAEKYYYAKKGNNPTWILRKDLGGVNGIRSYIFKETPITQDQLNKMLSSSQTQAIQSTSQTKNSLINKNEYIGKKFELVDGGYRKNYPPIKKALQTPSGEIFLKFSDNTEGNGQIDGIGGYYYLVDNKLYSGFNWDTKTNNWEEGIEPRFYKGDFTWI